MENTVIMQEDPSIAELIVKGGEEKQNEELPRQPPTKGPEYKPSIPYLGRLKQDQEDAQL